jgi:hypothetical protein
MTRAPCSGGLRDVLRMLTTKIANTRRYPRQPWGMPKLDQHRNKRGKFFLEIWEIITALSCLYTGFMVPYKLGFTMLYENMLDQRGEKYRCFWHHPAFRTSRWLDLLADVIFIADIVINFVSAHWELRVRPITHWHLVEDLQDISRRYLRGMFTVDLIGSIPLQHLDCIPNVSAPWLKIVRLARLFKLSRLHRIHLFIEGLKQKLPETIYVAFVIELFVFFFLFAHWTGCVFFFVNFGLGLPDAESVERSIINSYLTTEQIESFYDEGWAVKAGLLDETGAATDAGVGWNVWLASLYWVTFVNALILVWPCLWLCDAHANVVHTACLLPNKRMPMCTYLLVACRASSFACILVHD